MTLLICSLFLPKTLLFNTPGSHRRSGLELTPTTSPTQRPKTANRPEETGSPFSPRHAIIPPKTLTCDRGLVDTNDNDDSIRALFSYGSASDSGNEASSEGSCHASSPPPVVSCGSNMTFETAREPECQSGFQSMSLNQSETHDHVLWSAHWRVVDADQGNVALWDAAHAAARDPHFSDYIWVGTLGISTDTLVGAGQKQEVEDMMALDHNMLAVFCSDEDFDHFTTFCEQIVWPIFHYQVPDSPKSTAYKDHSWQYYINVNQTFADKVIANWKRGDTIWIHDYELLLLPGMIRKELPNAKIGFFLHIAFPSSEVFRCLAFRKQLLDGILGANLVGVQTEEYAHHFLQTCSRVLGVEVTTEGVQLDERFVNVTNVAIGIDPVNLDKSRGGEDVTKSLNVLRENYEGKKLIIARDKLDHFSGIRQKLLSYELFLNQNPQWRGRTVLFQVTPPTSKTSDYGTMVSDVVTRINSSWANLAYQPVVFLKQDIGRAQYLALLTIADTLMITSQREGMNLTAHDFVFCQDGTVTPRKKHGPLILSEFTGTASLFHKDGLSVNPWDYHRCAEAIRQALEMPDEEKSRRWKNLHEAVSRCTGSSWFSQYISQLDAAYDGQQKRDQSSVPRLSVSALARTYQKSQRRIFILDYEGTLVSHGSVDAIIPINHQRTVNILDDLLLDERNTVYIMSGRRQEELERLFQQLPNLGLVAENGCSFKKPSTQEWVMMADNHQISSWKDSVKPVLTYYLERTPGSEIVERACSILFHYKNAEDLEGASRQTAEFASQINDICESQRAHSIPMDHSIVIEPLDWTKKTAAQKVYETISNESPSPIDFLMVVGDGREDEQVFSWANALDEKQVKNVVTVSVGVRSTEAKATITHGISAVLTCLQRLVSSSYGS